MELKKNPKANLEKQKSTFFLVGMIISLSVVFYAFEHKTIENRATLGDLELNETEEEFAPITKQNQPPPPPPPPPPPVEDLIEIVDDEEEVEKVEFTSEADEDTEIEEIVIEDEVVEQQIFTIVEDMPAFKGCESMSDKNARNQCTMKKIQEFLYANMQYPEIAREAGLQGTVILTFVVDPKGNVTEVDILRGVKGATMLDREAKRIISSLPDFSPGRQRGKAVPVRYNLPVRFQLR